MSLCLLLEFDVKASKYYEQILPIFFFVTAQPTLSAPEDTAQPDTSRLEAAAQRGPSAPPDNAQPGPSSQSDDVTLNDVDDLELDNDHDLDSNPDYRPETTIQPNDDQHDSTDELGPRRERPETGIAFSRSLSVGDVSCSLGKGGWPKPVLHLPKPAKIKKAGVPDLLAGHLGIQRKQQDTLPTHELNTRGDMPPPTTGGKNTPPNRYDVFDVLTN